MKISKTNSCLAAALLLAISLPAYAKSDAAAPAEVKKQIAVLTSNASQKEKADACRELARTGTKEAVASLAALLTDEKLSHMARYGLETIPGPEVDKALRDALPKTQGRVKAGIIGSIGVRRDRKGVKPLAALLADQDAEVSLAAARALGKIGGSSAIKALEKALPETSGPSQWAVCEGLFRAAEASLSEGKRREAIAIYDKVRKLATTAHQVRTAALRGAVLARQADGIPVLIEALRGPDFGLFMAAARTSQEIAGSELTIALAKELPSLPEGKQVVLVQTLAGRKDPKALPALFTAARSGPKAVRTEAISALAQVGDESAAPVLLELLRDPDPQISRAAQENLAGLPGEKVDKAVMAMLAGNESEGRLKGIDLAARRRMASAVPALFKVASAPEPQARVAAVKRLGELAGPGEVPAFLDLLASAKSQEDMDAVEQALGSVCARAASPDACVQMVTGRLGQSQPAQKCALLRILTGVGGKEALQVVRTSLKDPNEEVKAAALRSLSAWNSADAAPDLLELARSAERPADKMVALRGYLDMAKRGELNETQRLTMCREAAALTQKPEEKRLLLAALGDIPSIESVAMIQPYVEDEATKEEASAAIIGISENLLKRNNRATFAPKLVEPLEKAAAATGNADLGARARKLLGQAKSK